MIDTDMNRLARENVRALTPYQSARRITGDRVSDDGVWLNANEFYQSPDFLATLSDAARAKLNRYPDPQPRDLLNAYASYAGVSPENVLVSRGADEAIELLIRAFCEPHIDSILYCPPTYGMYSVSAETFGVAVTRVPLTSEFQLDLPAIFDALSDVKLIYVCHPNNPTGNLLRLDDLRALLKRADRQLVIVDEAYIDFCRDHSVAAWLSEFPNLVILRTLSKAFALAGCRCGFAMARQEVIAILNKVIAPYPIPIPVADIATRALSDEGIAALQKNIAAVIENRAMLYHGLAKLSIVSRVFESHGNYILARFYDAPRVFQTLLNEGIVLRDQSRQLHLEHCLRVTIGSRCECEKTLAALAAIRE